MVKNDNPTSDDATHNESEMSEAEIDRNLQDTFPASDPPSWTLGTNHHAEPPADDAGDDDKSSTR